MIRAAVRSTTPASRSHASSNTRRPTSTVPYRDVAKRLQERGARIDRVVLDYELKRDYQRWLHQRDRERDDYDGHPDRTPREIANGPTARLRLIRRFGYWMSRKSVSSVETSWRRGAGQR
jgi:hypothetical protein